MTTEVKQLDEHPLVSPKTEPQPEKKPEQVPRSHGDVGFQKEPVVPGIVDFELIHEDLKTTKTPTLQPTPGAYRFGRLSHHSFFSRHHPQAQRVTHIQDIAGKPICMVRDEFSLAASTQPSFLSPCVMRMPTVSVPIGDPQSNRKPRLSTSATWRKNLKDLASRVTFFTKEIASTTNEQKDEPPMKDPSPREQGAKYSAETGRLIPAYSHALTRRNRQAQRGHTSGKGGGVQASILQDQELLVSPYSGGRDCNGLSLQVPRPSEPAPCLWEASSEKPPKTILELLCQILQTDSLRAIQFWLLYAPPKEKDLALGLLQTALAQLIPQPLPSIPAEKLWHQLQELQDPPQEIQQATYSPSLKKTKTPPVSKTDKPEYMGKAQVLLVHPMENPEEKMTKPKA